MSIYDDFDHFKQVSNIRYWGHNYYLKAYDADRKYVAVFCQKKEDPILFSLIKRRVV